MHAMSSNFTTLRWWCWSFLSVIAMCSYLYPVGLIPRVLKNTYFKKHLSVVASKNSICDMENETEEFTLCSMFKQIPNGKGMVYGPNGKRIMASLEYTLIIYSSSGKGMALWKIVFPSGNRNGKRKKRCTKKDAMSIKISFIHYRNHITWTRVKLSVVFEEFYMVYIFWFLLSFYYYCQLVQVQP